jgi:hypothetical protein
MRQAFAHPHRCPMDAFVMLRALVATGLHDEARRVAAEVDAHLWKRAEAQALLAAIGAIAEPKPDN